MWFSNFLGSIMVLMCTAMAQEADILRDMQNNSSDLKTSVLKELWESYFPQTPPLLQQFLQKQAVQEKKRYLFYFISRSVPLSSIKHNLKMAMSLPKDIVMYLVFRGMDKQTKEIIFKLAKWAKKQKVPFLIKIHPFMFRDLHIKTVPAFVLGECPSEFRYKKCQYEYIAFGDMSLDTFLKDVGDCDEKYRYFNSYFIH